MPHEVVPDHLHLAIEPELHVPILRVEGISIRRRMDRLELQQILGADRVELANDDGGPGGVALVAERLVEGDADLQSWRSDVLQDCRRLGGESSHGRDEGGKHDDGS